jgi:proteasome accessory factor B
MRKDFITRYKLLLGKINTAPATYEEIRDYLLQTDEFDRTNQRSYSIRTLQRDLVEIETRFGVVIGNKKKSDRRYFVKSKPDGSDWLFNKVI